MKEFIEKLIGRLKEEKSKDVCDSISCIECHQRYKNDSSDTCYKPIQMLAYDNAISIVNQLAEECNNDFCEWKFETTGIVWHCNGCETYNLPYAMDLMIIADDFECKCPHCGKKIKVVE